MSTPARQIWNPAMIRAVTVYSEGSSLVMVVRTSGTDESDWDVLFTVSARYLASIARKAEGWHMLAMEAVS